MLSIIFRPCFSLRRRFKFKNKNQVQEYVIISLVFNSSYFLIPANTNEVNFILSESPVSEIPGIGGGIIAAQFFIIIFRQLYSGW